MRRIYAILPSTEKLLPNTPKEPPDPGAQEMLLVGNVDDRAFLKALFEAMYPELPEPMKRK